MRFTRDTTLAAREPGRFEGVIAPGWDVLGNANGGYLMALLGRTAVLASDRPDVITLSAEFHSPGRVGPVTATTTELRAGRRFASTRVELRGDDRLIMTGTVQTGDLSALDGPRRILGSPSEIPPPDACLRAEPTDTFPPPFVGQIDARIHPADVPFIDGDRTELTMRSWFRLLDDEPMDTLAAVLACDASPPTIFNSHLEIGWVPTVQMTVHVRRRPSTAWLMMDTHTRFVDRGSFEVDCELWDEDGELVAQSRQLALTPLQG